ncbi:hypothetical protein C8R45DRAFT_290444 [Mycena sanguinolenta]|nr:hypothetical protein C8R45DRAFT_290444 [Mycena sanguinolenta]
MDFIPRETSFHAAVRAGIRWAGTRSNPEGIGAFNAPNRAAMFISSISLEQYDILCHECFGQHRYTLISTPTTVKLGAFIYFPFSSRQTAPVEVASLPPLLDVRNCSWPWINETLDISRYDSKPEANYERGRFVGESNWTRCDARLCLHPSVSFRTIGEHVYPWLSQGNCILSRLQRPSNPKDYAVVQKVVFQLIIFKSSQPIPEGYLFLCPAEQFKVGPSIFAWPDSPAYWSLDPSGADRLTMEDARRLGFPSFEMLTGIKTVSWDESVYAGVHHFQWAKGFDPYSQDAARQLGHPLYQLCTDTNEHGQTVQSRGRSLELISGKCSMVSFPG